MSAYAAEIIFFQLPTVSEGLFINYLGALCHNTYTVNMYEWIQTLYRALYDYTVFIDTMTWAVFIAE